MRSKVGNFTIVVIVLVLSLHTLLIATKVQCICHCKHKISREKTIKDGAQDENFGADMNHGVFLKFHAFGRPLALIPTDAYLESDAFGPGR